MGNVSATAAILVAAVREGIIEIAAYADEGLFRQHLAIRAIEIFKERYSKL